MDNYENWYCIKFEVPKNSSITAIEFSKKMNAFLQEIEDFNHSIVSGIDDTYTITSYVEDLETGSIKWWIKDKLSQITDKAIDKFVDIPMKVTIAGILKFAKTKVIEKLSDGEKPLEEISKEIIEGVYEVIESKSDILPKDLLGQCKIRIDEKRLLKSVSSMSKISKELEGGVSYIEDYDNGVEIKFSDSFAEYNADVEEKDTDNINITTRNLVVYKPQLDKNSKQWSFTLDNTPKTIDISETNIAIEAVNRGEIRVGDTYKVKLEEKEYETKGGFRIKYKILEVLEFERGSIQMRTV